MTITASRSTSGVHFSAHPSIAAPTLEQLPAGTKIWVRSFDEPWCPARILDVNSSEYPEVLIRSKLMIEQQGPRVPVFLYGSESW